MTWSEGGARSEQSKVAKDGSERGWQPRCEREQTHLARSPRNAKLAFEVRSFENLLLRPFTMWKRYGRPELTAHLRKCCGSSNTTGHTDLFIWTISPLLYESVGNAIVLLAIARKLTASYEILQWMTPSEAQKALQATECNELFRPYESGLLDLRPTLSR